MSTNCVVCGKKDSRIPGALHCEECELRQEELEQETKAWIDGASYESLLRRWRNAPVGDPMFQGVTGKYYADVMTAKRAEVGNAAHVAASKSVGWDG